MKKFKFKLEPILKYRKILKDQQEAKFVRAQNACVETQKYIQELAEMRDGVHQQMVQQAQEGFSLVQHEANNVYKIMIAGETSREKVRLIKRNKALEFERNRLIETNKNEQGIEKLKEKAHQTYQKEFLDWEMKQIDDLVSSRFGMKDNENLF